ncbi:MAG: S24/S26 family peptidase [Bacteroidales bacterium]|nr:S24/S26 family peptidase [Candidatus Cryptobacteroides aphodequi]
MNTVSLPNEIMLAEVARLLAEGHSVELRTKGSSMLPFIVGERDSVRLVRKPFAAGDMVLAKTSTGAWALHRVVSVENGRVTLKGDGNLRGTETAAEEDVAGVVEAILRPRGREFMPSARRAARWNALPYIVRRFYLAIYRRIV